MNDSLLTDDQRMIRDSARAFARARLALTAAERDRSKDFPRAEMAELGSLGFLGMLVPERLGGVGADHLGYVLAVEEIAAADGSIGAMMALHNGLVSSPLLRHGTEMQQERYLRPLAEGKINGAFGLTEPEAGSNAFAIATRARRCEGGYRITGTKQFMSNGKSADIAIVFATVDSDDPRRRITAFLVPPASTGYSVLRVEDKLGLSVSETCQVGLDSVFVPEDHVLGAVGGVMRWPWARSNSGGWGSRPNPWAWPARPSTWRMLMPANAAPSANRSSSIRPSASGWPTCG